MEKSMIRAILAHDAYWGIGKDGGLPWPKNDDDLAWFKQKTLGGTVVMGRNTWDSLPKRPLPGRKNAVVSNTMKLQDNVEVIRSDIYKSRLATMNYADDVWIIGGAKLLEDSLDIIDELLLNDVGGVYDCDTFLPKQKITALFHWHTIEVLSFGTITKWVRR
jgi:dihydrofolate reductase